MVLNIITLTQVEQKTLRQSLDAVEGTAYGAGFDSFLEMIQARQPGMPSRIVSAVTSFKDRSGRSGVLLIRGLPVEPLNTPTPTIPYEKLSDRALGTEKYLLAVAGLLGPPIGFEDWHRGERVQNLYPIHEMKSQQCASNSVYLEMHTETAFRPATPVHLALLCLRQDPRGQARTVFCDLRAIIDSMDPESRAILASARFCFRTSSEGAQGLTEPKPIDCLDGVKRQIHYAEALTAIDAAGRNALSQLKQRINANSVIVELEEGDLALIDNYHVIHGRTAFAPRYDGTDRWLQRALIGKSDEQAQSARPASTDTRQSRIQSS